MIPPPRRGMPTMPPGERGFDFVARQGTALTVMAQQAKEHYLNVRGDELREMKARMKQILWRALGDVDALPEPPPPRYPMPPAAA